MGVIICLGQGGLRSVSASSLLVYHGKVHQTTVYHGVPCHGTFTMVYHDELDEAIGELRPPWPRQLITSIVPIILDFQVILLPLQSV